MKRGDIWTVSGGAEYHGKPRPAVIVQADEYSEIRSVTLCPMSTHPVNERGIRLLVQPSAANGLSHPSHIMVDKISTASKAKLGDFVGSLEPWRLDELNRALADFLGLKRAS